MSTQELMRRIASGEKPAITLKDGRVLEVIDAPLNGRVKARIGDDVSEYVLRDIRHIIETVGLRDGAAPFIPVHDVDLPSDKFGLGQTCLTVRESFVGIAGIERLKFFMHPVDLSAVDWRTDELLPRLRRLVAAADFAWSDAVWQQIGNTIANNTVHSGTYWLDVTNDLRWSAGDFGDSSSCFWTCRKGARPLLEANSGYAVRFWSEGWERGLGRCWLVKQSGRMILFNGYGHLAEGSSGQLGHMAALVSHIAQCRAKKVDLCNHGIEDGDLLWINDGRGYVLGEFDGDCYDLKIEITDDSLYGYCEHCGDGLNEDDAYFCDDGRGPYCEGCFNELFAYCESCEELFDADDARQLIYRARWEFRATEHTVCPECWRTHGGVECYNCGAEGSFEYDSYVIDNDGDTWCEDCASAHLEYCEHCNEHSLQERGQWFHNRDAWLCENCLYDGVLICDNCGGMTEDRDTVCECRIAKADQLAFSYTIARLEHAMA